MSAAPMPWEEAGHQQAPMPWDEAKAASPNAGLAPPAGARVNIQPGPEGLERDPNKPQFVYTGPGAWPRSSGEFTGRDLVPGAIVGGTAAAIAAPTVIGAAIPPVAKFAVKHPIVTNMLASGAIGEARRIPYLGKMIPPMAEMIPWLRGASGEPEPEPGTAPPPVRWNPETESAPPVSAPPVRWNPAPEAAAPGPSVKAPPVRWNPRAVPTPTETPVAAAPTPTEYAPVQSSGDPILDRLRANATKIEAQGHGDEVAGPEESTPITTNLNEDLTPALKASLRKVRAAARARSTKPN